MTRTIVCFHAHPDDEALLMGGSMARLAAAGHRVVLVTATSGDRGLSAGELMRGGSLHTVRSSELQAAARILGCARVVEFGYPDSGSDVAVADESFAAMSVELAAQRLCSVLVEENADVLTIYDPAGGYGHPDHLQVNRVGGLAAELAGTPLVLEATVDRRLLQRALRIVRPFRRSSPDFDPRRFDELYSDPDRLTHRVDVRRYLAPKRAAMAAHSSQTLADDQDRSLAWMLRLPAPLFRLAFGHEWFVEHGRTPTGALLDDLLAGLEQPYGEPPLAGSRSAR